MDIRDLLAVVLGAVIGSVTNLAGFLGAHAGAVFSIATALQFVQPQIPGLSESETQLLIAAAAGIFILATLWGLFEAWRRRQQRQRRTTT
jgi:hypothetical protein